MTQIGKFIGQVITNSDKLKLPENKPERLQLIRTLIDSLVDYGGKLNLVCPVCPDYGSGNRFYRAMGSGLSPEAIAGVDGSLILSKILFGLGFNSSINIIVADTEDDLPEVVENCAGGDVSLYKSQCEISVKNIYEQLAEMPNIKVFTFTGFLGPEFREMQYLFEKIIRERVKGNYGLGDMTIRTGEERKVKHSQILGRSEKDYELTIRYMAQYAALGHIVRKIYPSILMNYQTPNRKFYNAAINVDTKIKLDDGDLKIVPVMGTVVKRNRT